MKVIRSLIVFLIFLVFVCLLKSPSAAAEEWTSPYMTGGIMLAGDNIFMCEEIDERSRRAESGDGVRLFGAFKLQATVRGRVSGGHTYLSDVGIRIVPDNYARVDGAVNMDSPTRVVVKRISFLTFDDENDRFGPLHVINLPPPAIDTTTTAPGNEYAQDIPLEEEICVPRDVVLNISYEAGLSGTDELIVSGPLKGLELRPFRWQVPVPGPVPRPAAPPAYYENVFFGYVYSADEARPLYGMDVHVKDYGLEDSRHRGYDTTDESGYFEVRFNAEGDRERTYKIYIGNDTEPSIVQDYYEDYYYDERKKAERVPPGEAMPVIFALEKKKAPCAVIAGFEPARPAENEEVVFTGKCYAGGAGITAYSWHSSVDGYLCDKSVFTTRDLTAGADHIISFSCADALGFTSPEDSLAFRINRRPRAYIYSIEPNPSPEAGAVSFRIDAFDDDPDGKIAKIKCRARNINEDGRESFIIYEGEPKMRIDRDGQPQLAQVTFDRTFLTEGEYEITATACDESGAWASEQGDVKRLVIGSVSSGDYDLVISGIDFLETPRAGEESRVRVNVTNTGADDLLVNNMKLSYHVGGTSPARNIISLPANFFVAAGGETSFDGVYWVPEAGGDQTLVFEIDFDYDRDSGNGLGVVEETDEYNVKEARVTVSEPVYDFPAGETERLEEIDLEIVDGVIEFSDPVYTVGRNIKIAARMKNTGEKKLYPAEAAFFVGEERIGEVEVGALDPGEEKRAVIWWTPDAPGEYKISAMADPRKRFDERDEENNSAAGSLTIEAPSY